jgi:DcuC family C4-dicarboxylate transporter
VESVVTVVSVAVVIGAVWLVWRGVDVRLVLLGAGLALGCLALRPWIIFDAFGRAMADAKTLGPICSAMGFAFVLRATGCDRELVRLLLKPIRHVRWLLVPGGCAVGFVTNMAITSQTASAAAVGPILIPIMLAAGWHPILIAATLVLGCSGGGNLYNPGDADVVAVQASSGAPLALVMDRFFLPELLGFITAVAAFTFFCRRTPSEQIEPSIAIPEASDAPVRLDKAALPLLPIALLLLLQPRFQLVPAVLKLYPEGLPVTHAMVFSMLIVMLIHRRDLSHLSREFFEGMGFAYTQVISLIITASCLITGMEAVGLVAKLVGFVASATFVAKIVSGIVPWMLGVLSGSGVAPSVAFAKAVLPSLSAQDQLQAVDLGVLASIGATFGRTSSPVAAVVIFTATLIGCSPMAIVRRTLPALAVGFVPVLVLMEMR